MSEPNSFVIDATAPFPKRWKCPSGPITVMTGPVKGSWYRPEQALLDTIARVVVL